MVESSPLRSPEKGEKERKKSRSNSRTKAKSSSKSRSRSRSRSYSRSRSRSRSRRRSRSVKRSGRSRSRSRSRRSRSRSRSRGRRRSRSRSGSLDLEGHRLHVADLDNSASKRDVEKVFEKYGKLVEVWMARSVPCFAFVVFKRKEDAYEACRSADGLEICGRSVRVTVARPRARRGGGGGGGGGGSFGSRRGGFDPDLRCYQCGNRGHFSRDCPDTMFGYKRPPSPRAGYRAPPAGARRSRSRSRRRSRSRSRRRRSRSRS